MIDKDKEQILNECFDRGLFEMLDNDKFKVTEKGKEYLQDKAVEMYNAAITLGRIPQEVPEKVGAPVYLKSWLAAHENDAAQSIYTLVKDVEPIGFINFIKFHENNNNETLN